MSPLHPHLINSANASPEQRLELLLDMAEQLADWDALKEIERWRREDAHLLRCIVIRARVVLRRFGRDVDVERTLSALPEAHAQKIVARYRSKMQRIGILE